MFISVFLIAACAQQSGKRTMTYIVTTDPPGARCIHYGFFEDTELKQTPGQFSGPATGEVRCKKDGYKLHKFDLSGDSHYGVIVDKTVAPGPVKLDAKLELLEDGCSESYKFDPIKGLLPRNPLIGKRALQSTLDAPDLIDNNADRPEAADIVSGYTVLSDTTGFGNQVTYFASDGRAYLWFPGNTAVIPEEWRSEPGKLCIKHPEYSVNAVTKKRGGQWQCVFTGLWSNGVRGRLSGDVFDLSSSGKVPYRRDRDDSPQVFEQDRKKYSKPECGYEDEPFDDIAAARFINSILPQR